MSIIAVFVTKSQVRDLMKVHLGVDSDTGTSIRAFQITPFLNCKFSLILTLYLLLLCEGMTMAFVGHTSSFNQQPRWLQFC